MLDLSTCRWVRARFEWCVRLGGAAGAPWLVLRGRLGLCCGGALACAAGAPWLVLVLRATVVPWLGEEMGVSADESRPYEALQRVVMELLLRWWHHRLVGW